MTSPADAAQHRASDPAVSAFVAASAGSGKTKLLTDRLLRLMLVPGARPERILCLTFTKAAAAEMAIRLQRRLSEWVTAPDERIDRDLRAFGIVPGPAQRDRARALFAEVLDVPGGMRIGTIHAFCQSLLRRFPLEANLSPHFRLLESLDAETSLREAREAMLGDTHTDERRRALTALAGLVSLDGFGKLVARLETDRAKLRRALDLQDNGMVAALDRVAGADRCLDRRETVAWRDAPALRRALVDVAASGAATIKANAQEMLDWLALGTDIRAENWKSWRELFLLKNGKPRAASKLVNEALSRVRPDLLDALLGEQARILGVEDCARATTVSDVSAALLRLAAPVIDAYAADKERAERLDYADLIGRTGALLHDPGSAWVLYKLDGGIDHLLLDEVQDTAPAQWEIAGALTAEFFAGTGARNTDAPARTVFAVGDPKQSIYSFQGADPHAFEHWRAEFARRATAGGGRFEDVPLDVSFRSTEPVLALVDAVFDDPLAAAGVTQGDRLAHRAHRAGHGGTVELWPVTPLPEHAPPEAWQVPTRNLGGVSAPQRLAQALADWIARQTDAATAPLLESRGRRLTPGDVLILVRRRNDFARALVAALKQRGVPVAGIDRMMLTEQPAVSDLLALCDALLLPEDELQFACMLTSPLGGLTDQSLMELALGRTQTLRATLRRRAWERADWRAAEAFFSALLARVDYVSPYALLVEALGPLGGRARLLARLGPEAAEPIDELLGKALSYGELHVPALQGFVHWLRLSGAEVKREAEGAGQLVRIMTVHGAKGLEAPLVILPDTTTLPQDEGSLLWADDPASGVAVPLWSPRAELRCAAADRLRKNALDRQMEEYNRLLYVALTRAQDRLLVCGWETRHAHRETCWYEAVRRGLQRLDAEATPFEAVAAPWDGVALRHVIPQRVEPVSDVRTERRDAAAPLPAWAGAAPHWRALPAPPEPALPQPLAPSQPQDADLGPVPAADSPLAARDTAGRRFRRGQLAHALLQHLPALPRAGRDDAARRYLGRPGSGLTAREAASLAAEVADVLDHPELAPLFGPSARAEVPLTGVVDGVVVGGLVDRLALLDDRVLVADYKTNRDPPGRAEAVPVLYLRQMAAYRAVLRGAFPGRAVVCALVWTTGAQVMRLPDALLDRHAPGARTADPGPA